MIVFKEHINPKVGAEYIGVQQVMLSDSNNTIFSGLTFNVFSLNFKVNSICF